MSLVTMARVPAGPGWTPGGVAQQVLHLGQNVIRWVSNPGEYTDGLGPLSGVDPSVIVQGVVEMWQLYWECQRQKILGGRAEL